ncbi:MAG: outer membrane protein assembly factor BamE [Paracoccaceae bacterium]|jgi:outer membrane protein assembly factor BamE (lipoprotein component of BamABCDE complex)
MIVNTPKLASLRAILMATVVAVSIAGCTAMHRNHGYVPTTEQLNEITPGVDTRDTVAETIGAPTSSGVLNDGGYYYIASQMRHYGPAKPKVVSRELVAINFNSTGTVTGVQHFSLEDGRVIPLQRRVTDSSLENKTFLRQLLGNVGNFNPGQFLN